MTGTQEGNVCKTIFADIIACNDIPREWEEDAVCPPEEEWVITDIFSDVWVRS